MWIVPLVGSSCPPIMRSVVVLPQPDGPRKTTYSPFCDLEVDVVDRDDAAGEDPADLVEDQPLPARTRAGRAASAARPSASCSCAGSVLTR